MNKKLIRLTESDLHRIVKESVNKTLREATTLPSISDKLNADKEALSNVYQHLTEYYNSTYGSAGSDGRGKDALMTCLTYISRTIHLMDKTMNFGKDNFKDITKGWTKDQF